MKKKSSSPMTPELTGEYLNRVAFPMGGIGSGMICLEGTGALSHVSLRHRPDIYHEPQVFSALHVEGAKTARVLEGPVPKWKPFGKQFGTTFRDSQHHEQSIPTWQPSGCGAGMKNKTYGFPRFKNCSFSSKFPFATLKLSDPSMPVDVQITGWSPFIPGNSDDSSLPVAGLEFRFTNKSRRRLKATYSFNAANFMKTSADGNVLPLQDGFILNQPIPQENKWNEGAFAAFVPGENVRVDCAWFRGGWFDPLTMAWKNVASGSSISKPPYRQGAPSPGASLFVPFSLSPGGVKTIRLLFSWYVPRSDLRTGTDEVKPKKITYYQPWYSSRFGSIREVSQYWRKNYVQLRNKTEEFTNCFYDTTLPPEFVEAISANLTILKSPTCLREKDGKFWGWEGCHDMLGSCQGTCTHVWNYAQALSHLFPDLERSIRETEFFYSQNEEGHQAFRAFLPIRRSNNTFHAAADGQLGGIMKLYREWRISGDTKWMAKLFTKAKESIDYCIRTWDPNEEGWLIEPHHNTYDIEFWGPDGMCTSFYIGALDAIAVMGEALGVDVSRYALLLEKARRKMERSLWNGEYFIQKIQWKNLKAWKEKKDTFFAKYSLEAMQISQKEGPKYQYGNGCLSDGVIGDWMGRCCGQEPVLNSKLVRSHLKSVFKNNFKADLSDHANPQRPGYAVGNEGGLILCSWPKGDKLSLPFVYSDEVWTGIEYQVAAHLVMLGMVNEGRQIVRTLRKRYDGRFRNPFNEYEWGHWYARAMASYSLIQACSGARYDALEKALYLKPTSNGDFKSFLSTATGFGSVGIRKGKPFCEVVSGKIPIRKIIVQS